MSALVEEILESLLKNLGCGRGTKMIFSWIGLTEKMKLNNLLNKLNKFHPTTKFTCDYSWERVHFLDVQAILEHNKISTRFYVKETPLIVMSPIPYHCVKPILYSEDLRLKCSNNIFYDNPCNQLEKWISDGNYKQKIVKEQILKTRAVSRGTLLNNERNPWVEDRLLLNLTHHPLLRDFQNVLNEAQILLMSNEECKTVFGGKPPMT